MVFKRDRYTTVYIHYFGKQVDGTLIDDNRAGEPLEVILGMSTIPYGLESVLFEMEVGEERTITLSGEDAFGDYDEEGIIKVPTYKVPHPEAMPVGEYIQWAYQKSTRPVLAKVVDVSDLFVTLDLNHPLAGQEITYWVKIEAEDSTPKPPVDLAWLYAGRKDA